MNVAGRDLGLRNGPLVRSERRAVVEERPDAVEPARRFLIENDDLPVAAGRRERGCPFAVHLDEGRCPLDDAVQFRCEEVPVGGDSHVEGLTASPEGEVDLSRRQVADHRNGVGSFEIVHGEAKGLIQRMPFLEVFFDLKRDDLRVRRQFRGDEIAAGFQRGPQRLVVVDIAVENDVDRPVSFAVVRVAPDGRPGLPAVAGDRGVADRMAILFGDGADRCPARMRDSRLAVDGQIGADPEDFIPGDLRAEFMDVSAQRSDDRGGLVDEGNAGGVPRPVLPVPEDADGAAAQIAGSCPLPEGLFEASAGDLGEKLPAVRGVGHGKGYLDARRVAAADLEAVDAVEQEVEFFVFGEGLRREFAAFAGRRQADDSSDVFEDVPFDRPEDVFEEDEPRVDGFEILGVELSGAVLQGLFLFRQERAHGADDPGELFRLGGIEEEAAEDVFPFEIAHETLHIGEPTGASEVVAGSGSSRQQGGNAVGSHRVELLVQRPGRIEGTGRGRQLDRQDPGQAAEKDGRRQRKENKGGGADEVRIDPDANAAIREECRNLAPQLINHRDVQNPLKNMLPFRVRETCGRVGGRLFHAYSLSPFSPSLTIFDWKVLRLMPR